MQLYTISNLPYYITITIIISAIEKINIDKMVVMIQKEAQNRFKVNVGIKN